jgi:prepilin-type N-terminal cleavage/methylation domain-containing protein
MFHLANVLSRLRQLRFKKGFTLAELLITLQILAIIAAFTIPKIIGSQQNSTYKAIAKEDIASVAAAYQLYVFSNTPIASTTGGALTPYLNYVKLDTSGAVVDDISGYGTLPCDSSAPCMRMHNGGTLQITPYSFNGTNTTNAIRFKIDPDGKVTDGTTNGPGKSLSVRVYIGGRVTSEDNMLPNTCDSAGCFSPAPGQDPTWFSW